MKTIKLLHNPGAGDGQYNKKALISLLESKGFRCKYFSTKNDKWLADESDADMIAVAGGDGTIRRVAAYLLNRKLLEKQIPIGILPMGTANNIATTLHLSKDLEAETTAWQAWKLQPFDIGHITGIKDRMFFLESFGFGVFPNLMNEMHKLKSKPAIPEEEIKLARKILTRTVEKYKARKCRLVIDGIDHSGKFLMVEVLNVKLIGPNMLLNAHGHPGDGEIEIVIIPEEQRDRLSAYAGDQLYDASDKLSFTTIKGRDIHIQWEGIHVHVDDEIIKNGKMTEADITVRPGVLQFLDTSGSDK